MAADVSAIAAGAGAAINPALPGRAQAGPVALHRAPHRPRGRSATATALIVTGMLLFAALAGVLIALAGPYAAAAIAAIVLLIASLFVPLGTLFFLFIGVVFVLVGQVQYFGRIDKAFWVPYLMALLFYLRLVRFGQPAAEGGAAAGTADARPAGRPIGLLLALLGLFLLTAAASSVINEIPLLQWVVAGKEYFFLWSIFLAFVVGALGLRHLVVLVRWLPWFLAAQIPVVAYQRFVVAAKRVGGSPWDAVVGLFGGNPQAGGASGTMAIFSMVAVVLLVEAWKAGQASGRRALATCVFALTACALAEVKLVIVLLPLLLLLVFGAELLRRPLLALAGLLAGVVLTVGLLTLYQQQFTSSRTREGRSVTDYVQTMIERNTTDSLAGVGYGEMGRATALRFWARQQSMADPAGLLLGHGLGSSRIGGLVVGDLVKQYQLRLARSALVVYLWETGLIGTTALVLGLLAAIAAARRLARRPELAEHAWLLKAAAVNLGIVLVTLPYGPDFMEVSQMQILALLLLGVVAAAARLQGRATPAARL